MYYIKYNYRVFSKRYLLSMAIHINAFECKSFCTNKSYTPQLKKTIQATKHKSVTTLNVNLSK